MVKRYDEFMEIGRIQEDINKLFDLLMQQPEAPAIGGIGTMSPSVDILETDDLVFVRVELPGVSPEDLELTLSGNKLNVTGVKKAPKLDDKEVTFICMERVYGRFTQNIYVNFPINTHKATAEYRSGFLFVKLPKVKDRRGEPFAIPVTTTPDAEEENV